MPDAPVVDRAARIVSIPAIRRLAPVKSYNADRGTVTVMWGAGARVLRYDWWEGEYFTEELDMSGCDLERLNTGAPVLDTHQRYELENVIGVVERAWVENGEGYAEIRLSEREDLAWLRRDVADGIVRNVSVGYDVNEMEQRGFDEATGYPRMVVTAWQPFELSFVPVGADAAAGTRSAAPEQRHNCTVRMHHPTPAAPAAQPQERSMEAVNTTPAAGPQAADVQIVRDQARDAELARIREITATGRQFDCVAEADAAIAASTSVAEFQRQVLEVIKTRNAAQVAQTRDIGMTEREQRRYSLMRCIRAMVDNNWRDAGLEREAHQAVMQKLGIEPTHERGFFVPHEIQRSMAVARGMPDIRLTDSAIALAQARQFLAAQQRDLTVATAADGGRLVATDNLAGSFIELLRNRSLVAQLGATMLPGLVGQVTIPRQTAAATAYWLANEATAITESQMTFGQLALSAKNVGAYTEISRQLMLQSSPAVDMLVYNDLQRVLALAVDAAAIAGSGASGQPTGLLNTAGIGSVTGTSIAYAGIVEFQTDVAGANALTPSCAFVTTPTVAGLLKQRQRFASTDTPLWQGNVLDGDMEGFRASSTLQMSAATMAFGDWSQIVMAEWGTLEIGPNPYANFAAAITGIRAIVTVDIGVRIAGAFSVASSIT